MSLSALTDELETMLRIHLLQELYDWADMAVMNEGTDIRAFSEFCGVDSRNQVPDGDTIGRFGYQKTRYKGRRKQEAKLHMQFAPANLILADRRCLAV